MIRDYELVTKFPLPMPTSDQTQESFTVDSTCIACGLTVEERVTLLVHLQPCKHSYHYICFAALCSVSNKCVGDCSTEIPYVTHQSFGGTASAAITQLTGKFLITVYLKLNYSNYYMTKNLLF